MQAKAFTKSSIFNRILGVLWIVEEKNGQLNKFVVKIKVNLLIRSCEAISTFAFISIILNIIAVDSLVLMRLETHQVYILHI